MPLTYESSDVYIEERDLSQSTSAASTSIGAIVFASRRGPLGRRKVTSGDKFRAKYGNPDASISMAHYAALAFLGEATEMWANRVVGAGATYGGLVLQMRSQSPVDPNPVLRGFTIGDPANIDFTNIAGSSVLLDNILAFYNDGPGSYSKTRAIRIVSRNLRVPTNVQAADFSTVGVIITGVPVAGNIQAGSYSYTVTAFNEIGETLASTVATVTISTASTSVYLSWNPVEGATGYKVYGRTNGNDGLVAVLGGGDLYYIDRGTVTPNAAQTAPTTQNFTDRFQVQVFDFDASVSTPAETFNCALTEQIDGYGAQLEVEQVINLQSEFVQVRSNASMFPGALPTIYSTGIIPLAAGVSGAAVTSANISLGWEEFRDAERVGANILINGGYSIPSVQLKMDTIASARGDAVAILDVPALRQKAQQAVDYRGIDLNLNSNRSALYTPDLLIEDEFSGKTLYVPPSGHVAGVYAKTDRVAYPWYAPAGLNRATLNVLGVRWQYDKGERDMLWRSQVNYVRNFQGLGRAIWEQRTLQAIQSGFSFVSVRRLFDFLAMTIKRAMYSKEFEPNDDTLRNEIRILIERFLVTVQNARGINKFVVICDGRNNPSNITAQGQLNVDVFVEPTLPAEKIRVRMNLTAQGVDFAELLSNIAL